MQTIHLINDVKVETKKWKREGKTIGFVPTMGYLHEGHLSLIQTSVAENDRTVVSIYVNPTQFAPGEDLAKYPRDFAADSAMCEEAGVDLIFCPKDEEMYPSGFSTFVNMDKVTAELCGKSRPSHFRGVCTVVNKLFNVVTPTRAYFGRKDAQQLAVIKRMVRDLNMDVEIVGCPLVREKDGLAKSSRNSYLTEEERKAALILSKAIFEGERIVKEGEKSAAELVAKMREIIQTEPLARIDYIEVTDSETIEKKDIIEGNILAAIAVYIGKTRLIDNFFCEM